MFSEESKIRDIVMFGKKNKKCILDISKKPKRLSFKRDKKPKGFSDKLIVNVRFILAANDRLSCHRNTS